MMPLESSPATGSRVVIGARVLVLACSGLLMLVAAWTNSVTLVVTGQLPAGLAAWQRHSLGLYRVCGPLSKFLYALPPYLAGVRVDYPADYDQHLRGRLEWAVGGLFEESIKSRYMDICRWRRLLFVSEHVGLEAPEGECDRGRRVSWSSRAHRPTTHAPSSHHPRLSARAAWISPRYLRAFAAAK